MVLDTCAGVVPVYLTYMQRGPAGTMVLQTTCLQCALGAACMLKRFCGPQVDVLQACCGNAYRLSWFNPDKLKHDLPRECFTTDDLWIAGYLSAHGDIKKVCLSTPLCLSFLVCSLSAKQTEAHFPLRQAIIPKRLDPESPEWKAKEPKKWRLSTVNTNDMKDIKCINGVKRVYGNRSYVICALDAGSDDALWRR